jgi:acetyl esterase/lipase
MRGRLAPRFRAAGVPLFVYGESMGGHLALQLARRYSAGRLPEPLGGWAILSHWVGE